MLEGFGIGALIELIGFDDARKLMLSKGGQQIYIPKNPVDSWLIEVIGTTHTQTLCSNWGGCFFEVPKGTAMLTAARDKRIQELSEQKSLRELSIEFGLCERRIRQILARERVLTSV